MTTYLSADAILGASDLRFEDVPVPEWGGTVRVRELTGVERDRLEASMAGRDGKTDFSRLEGFRARLAAASIVDAEGQRIFRSDAEVRRLAQKSATALQRVCEVATRLSGMTEQDVAELEGN